MMRHRLDFSPKSRKISSVCRGVFIRQYFQYPFCLDEWLAVSQVPTRLSFYRSGTRLVPFFIFLIIRPVSHRVWKIPCVSAYPHFNRGDKTYIQNNLHIYNTTRKSYI